MLRTSFGSISSLFLALWASLNGLVLRTLSIRFYSLDFAFIPGASHQLLQLIFYYDSAVGRELCSKAAVKDVNSQPASGLRPEYAEQPDAAELQGM